jgi:nitroimidazol reductase NimA-like FMN-containing flavoprotein (pyridoxamine 5'-phosphate oxidase superfamily)
MGGDRDRNGLEVLSEEECWELLRHQHIGRLAVAIANQPEIFPVNYVVHDGAIFFLTAEGTKFAGAVLGTSVAFEIDAADPLFHTGWSVVVRGSAVEVETMDELVEVEALPLRPWGPGVKRRYVKVVPEHVTGRRIAVPGEAGAIAEH